ncbi:hypothetical protein EB001_15050 [bacterium]|nr:hypothetical protein [bacterium]
MTFYDEIQKIKTNQSATVFKGYFLSDISWQQILDFLYTNASLVARVSQEESKRRMAAKQNGTEIYGDVYISPPLWIKSQTGNVWEQIPQLKNYLYKLNQDTGFKEKVDYCTCHEYKFKDVSKCGSTWHLDGIIISLAQRRISEHKDLEDSVYLQMIGNSFWKIKGKEETEFMLEPGDIILVPNEVSHEVWGNGPRSGLLLAGHWL